MYSDRASAVAVALELIAGVGVAEIELLAALGVVVIAGLAEELDGGGEVFSPQASSA